MDRYEKVFAKTKKEKRIAFMPFLVGGDPTPAESLKILKEVVRHADALELGIPFSDPVADGPTVQKADTRALDSGTTPTKALNIVRELRKTTDIPITFLVYANLVYQYSIEKFYKDATRAGVDGILIPDVPVEELEPFQKAAKKAGIKQVPLITLTTNKARRKKILRHAEGFIYIVSVRGVTGARKDVQKEALRLVRSLKKETKLPLVVGFGISTRKHIKTLERAGADGAIVGSALVQTIEKNLKNPVPALRKHIKRLRQ